jgi:DNA-binding GntR family transcriptional regulator
MGMCPADAVRRLGWAAATATLVATPTIVQVVPGGRDQVAVLDPHKQDDRSRWGTRGDVPLPGARREEAARSSAELAASYIRRLIFDRTLPAGSRIPQDDVARALGLTRMPIREALLILQREGRVRIEKNRGAYVFAISEQSARDACELSARMHCFAIERAMERVTSELLASLRAANSAVRETTDPVELYYAFDGFEDCYVRFGLGERLALMLSDLRRFGPDTMYVGLDGFGPFLKEHTERMLRAFETKDLPKAVDEELTFYRMIIDKLAPVLRNVGIVGE